MNESKSMTGKLMFEVKLLVLILTEHNQGRKHEYKIKLQENLVCNSLDLIGEGRTRAVREMENMFADHCLMNTILLR